MFMDDTQELIQPPVSGATPFRSDMFAQPVTPSVVGNDANVAFGRFVGRWTATAVMVMGAGVALVAIPLLAPQPRWLGVVVSSAMVPVALIGGHVGRTLGRTRLDASASPGAMLRSWSALAFGIVSLTVSMIVNGLLMGQLPGAFHTFELWLPVIAAVSLALTIRWWSQWHWHAAVSLAGLAARLWGTAIVGVVALELAQPSSVPVWALLVRDSLSTVYFALGATAIAALVIRVLRRFQR
jgi:hypothetical protein